RKGKTLEDIAEDLHTETVRLSLEGDYVDDISFFLCWSQPPYKNLPTHKVSALPPKPSKKPSPQKPKKDSNTIPNQVGRLSSVEESKLQESKKLSTSSS